MLPSDLSSFTEGNRNDFPLPPPPDPRLDVENDSWREMRANWPLWIQYLWRDSGLLRFVVDASAPLVAVLERRQSMLSSLHLYMQRSVKLQRISYGKHPRQVIDLFINPPNNTDVGDEKPLMVFVHGGAWGSGYPSLYRLVMQTTQPRDVAILGYRTYPSGSIQEQVSDVCLALQNLHHLFPGRSLQLVGHSSGAHLTFLAAAGSLPPSVKQKVACIVGLSGVYNIPLHYQYEKLRGVERISPLAPACGTLVDKRKFPVRRPSSLSGQLLGNWKKVSPTFFVRDNKDAFERFGAIRFYLVHGVQDTTVPYTQTLRFAAEIRRTSGGKLNPVVKLYNQTGHTDTVTQLMFGGQVLDDLVEWLDGE